MRQLLPPSDLDPDLVALYAEPALARVRGGFVLGVDGGVAVDGNSRALSGPADRTVFRTLRAVCDVIVVGAGTARVEDYGTIRLTAEGAAWRKAEGLPPLPRVAVVSRSLDLDERLFAHARPLVLTCEDADLSRIEDRADVIVAGTDTVDIGLALDLLAGEGLGRVLCEGGPRLLASVVAADRLDELCLTTTPLLVGRAPDLLPLDLGRPLGLRLRHLLEDQGTLVTRYDVVRRPRHADGDGEVSSSGG
jgi:riboflavin biosynthesis pyrimidine reductase